MKYDHFPLGFEALCKSWGSRIPGDTPSWIAGQALQETGHFTSTLWTSGSNNFLGIKPSKNSTYLNGVVFIHRGRVVGAIKFNGEPDWDLVKANTPEGATAYASYPDITACAKDRFRILDNFKRWVEAGVDPFPEPHPLLKEEIEHLTANVPAQTDRWWAPKQHYESEVRGVVVKYGLADLDVPGALPGVKKGVPVSDKLQKVLAVLTFLWHLIEDAEDPNLDGAAKKKAVMEKVLAALNPYLEGKSILIRKAVEWLAGALVDELVDLLNKVYWKKDLSA